MLKTSRNYFTIVTCFLEIDADIVEKIQSLIFVLDQRGLFRGLGGILMRNAVCLLIEKSSIAALPYHNNVTLIGEKCSYFSYIKLIYIYDD